MQEFVYGTLLLETERAAARLLNPAAPFPSVAGKSEKLSRTVTSRAVFYPVAPREPRAKQSPGSFHELPIDQPLAGDSEGFSHCRG